MLANTYRRQLRVRAVEQYGYVTTVDAHQLRIPVVELRKIAARGGLRQVARGVYRFEDIPRTHLDRYMEAVLRVGYDAHIAGESVLALHDLALVNPLKICVSVGTPTRKRLPRNVALVVESVNPSSVVEFEGIPASTVARAIRDCRGRVMRQRLQQATDVAAEKGLISRQDARSLHLELRRK